MRLGSNTRTQARAEAVKRPSLRDRAATIVYFATPYTILLGLAYLWAYWSAFGISIVEYLTVGDIFRLAAFPVAAVAIVVAVGTLLAHFTPFEVAEERKVKVILSKPWIFVILLAATVLMLLIAGSARPFYSWIAAVALVGMPTAVAIGVFLRRARAVNELALDVVAVLLGVLPFAAGANGALAAAQTLSGERFSVVLSEIVGLPANDSKRVEDAPRFLGHAGNRYFLWLPKEGAAVIVDKDQAKTLTIARASVPPASAPAAASKAGSASSK